MAEKYKWKELKKEYEEIKKKEKNPSKSNFVKMLDVIFKDKTGYIDLLKNAIKGFYEEMDKNKKTYINDRNEKPEDWERKKKERIDLYNKKYKKPICNSVNSIEGILKQAKQHYDSKKLKGPTDKTKIAFLVKASATVVEKQKRYYGDDVAVQLISSGGYRKQLKDI